MVQLSTSWQLLNSTTLTYYSSFSGTFQLWAKYSTQEVANNRTKVHYSWEMVLNSGWITSYDAQDYLTNVGWNDATYREYSSSKTLRTWEGWINHNADGTGSGSCTGRTRMGGMGLDTGDVSASYTLPTIPRASQPTASPNPLTIGSSGATLTVNTNRKSSSFMHTVKVQCGSWSWTSTARSVGASVNVTIPYAVVAQFSATSKTASATVTCTTFSGSTQIGSAQTCSVTFQISTSVDHPNVGTITISDTNTTTHSVVQDNTKYVAYKSTLSASIPLTVSGSYTQLASATVTCGTKTQNYTLSGTSQTITFTFANVNANKLTVTVKDKRGTSASGSKSWTLLNYSPLTMTASVARTSATGSTATGKVTGNAYGGTFGASTNSLTISYQWKLHSASTWTSGANTYTQSLNSGVSAYTKNITFAESFDYTNQYDIKFTVSDLFTTVTYTCQLMQGLPILSWDETEVDVFGNLHIHDRANPTSYWNLPSAFDAMMLTGGQKNVLPMRPSNTEITTNGITFTFNQTAGTITANGTATARATATVLIMNFRSYNNYIFTCTPSGGSSTTYYSAIEERQSPWTDYAIDYGNGSVLTGVPSGETQNFYVRIASGVTVNNLVFKPMLRHPSIASDYFLPYAPSNLQMYIPTGITSDFFTDLNGFTVTSSNVYRLGRLIIGNMVLDHSTDMSATSYTLTIKPEYRPRNGINSGCFVKKNQWTGGMAICYIYISTAGALTICPVSSGYRYVEIDICYLSAV